MAVRPSGARPARHSAAIFCAAVTTSASPISSVALIEPLRPSS